MELSKQGQPRPVSGSAAPRQPLPSVVPQSAQLAYPAYPAVFYPDNWGAQVPISSYLIVPVSQQPAQVGALRPSAPHLSGARPLSRVSLRPPQQVLSVQTALPGIVASQPSPSAGGKKMAAPPKVQMLKSVLSQSSACKRSVQKELPLKAQPQFFESVRWKFRDTLAAALSMDSDQQSVQQSVGNVWPVGSAGENKQADSDAWQGSTTTTSQDAGKAETDTVTEVADRKSEHDNMLSSNLGSNMAIKVSDDMLQQLVHVPLENEILGNSTVALDELLQGHGLCWAPDIAVGASESMSQPNSKRVRTSDIDAGVNVSQIEPESKRTKTAHEATEEKKGGIEKAQSLAFRIEEELFKLFGGVNKKYKEKGRSLLFNLKDKSNPVLRERVLSGDITPKCLCTMTTEELASKELSEWRMAKAEELAKMVVLPNREVDVRRLVRKTHKGEFQVEVEETDGISMEVGLGGDLLSHVPSKPIEGQTKSDDRTSLHREDKESNSTAQDGLAGTGNSNLTSNLENPANEKTDLMQELMVDDLKDTENLPPIMSLDEFMETLDSEPPFEDHSSETVQVEPNSIDKVDIELKSEKIPITEDKAAASEFQFNSDVPSPQDNSESKLECPKTGSVSLLDPVKQPKGDMLVKSSPEKVDAEKPDTVSGLIPESTMQCKTTPDAALTHDSIWEGTIQLTLSSLTNVVAIFKSGEKPSTNEWHRLVEIKGRVRLSAFEEFLEQLPKSRSRAMMVTELRWKEGSLESGRQHLLQTIDSYITDERVGLVKPAEGVELYLCPSQGKTVQILADHLPNEHSGSLTVTGTSVIGVVVWRRTHVSPRIPNRHDGSRRESISRKHQAVISSSVPISSQPTKSPGPPSGSSNERCHRQDVVTDDVPPGFGPGGVRDDDDLPEYDFVSISNAAANVTSQAYRSQQHTLATSRPVDPVREMVRKYGNRSAAAQPWDDDDIPEWDPNQSNLQQSRHPQPPLPPPPPVQQMHPYHHQQQMYHSMQQQYHVTQESQNPMSQAYVQPQHIAAPVQRPVTYGHPMQPAQAQSVQLGWQPNAQWLSAGAPPQAAAPAQNVAQQSYFGVVPDGSDRAHGAGNQGAMAWMPQ